MSSFIMKWERNAVIIIIKNPTVFTSMRSLIKFHLLTDSFFNFPVYNKSITFYVVILHYLQDFSLFEITLLIYWFIHLSLFPTIGSWAPWAGNFLRTAPAWGRYSAGERDRYLPAHRKFFPTGKKLSTMTSTGDRNSKTEKIFSFHCIPLHIWIFTIELYFIFHSKTI